MTRKKSGMWDIDKGLDPLDIKIVHVAAFPVFIQCAVQHRYSPGFPLMLNGNLIGYPCGNCITDFLEVLVIKNPSVVISDNRKILYN